MSEKKHVTLQQYLKGEGLEGKTEFRIVVDPNMDGLKTKFYIHPLNADGDSRDFAAFEDTVVDVTEWLPGA